MQHRILGLIAAALCAVMLFTSCRHAEQVEPADMSDVMNNAAEDVLPLPAETAVATKEPAADPVALPESIDPLGFYRAQQEEGLTADLAAEKYNAKYERVAGLYEVKNVYLDGRDARLWLQTNEDSTRIKQAMLVHLYYSRVYDALYSEIIAVLGDADELSIYDDYYNRVPIEAYDSDEHPFAVWKLGDYTLELGVNPPGNMAQGFYLVAFQGDECDYEMSGFFYEQKGPCCPHETNFHFTEECIFMEPELFRGDAAAIFENTEQRTHMMGKGPADIRTTIVISIIMLWRGLIISVKAHALYLENPNPAPESSTVRAMRSTLQMPAQIQ